MEALNNNVSSMVDEDFLEGEMQTEELLLHRLSPYATQRSDVPVLLGISQRSTSPDHHHKSASSLVDNAVVGRSESDDEEDFQPEPKRQDVVVRGQDIGDLPADYVVRGLRPHEMPVIGVYVDPRIIPGFRYRVRRLGTEHYLFDGRALTLQSVGMGYGKRLTFRGDSLNFNDNYFWSDSDPKGVAFSLDAVQPRSKLTVYGSDGLGVIGEVTIERILGLQEEISSEVVNGDVVKRARVTLECNVTYFQRHHRGVNLKLHDVERMTGEAIVIKKKRTRVAALDCIHHVTLACAPGKCTLQVE